MNVGISSLLVRLRRGDRARVLSHRGLFQAAEEEIPALPVDLQGLVREVVVPEPDERALAVGLERDLDPARPRRHGVLPLAALPAPREHDAFRRVDLQVLAAGDGLVVDVDPVDAAGTGIELGLPALPLDHLVGIGEELEHGRGPRRDPHLTLDDIALFDVHCVSSLPRARPPTSGAPGPLPRSAPRTRAARSGPPASPGRDAGFLPGAPRRARPPSAPSGAGRSPVS